MCPGLSAVGSSWILGFETRRGVMSRRYPPEFRRRVLDLMESRAKVGCVRASTAREGPEVSAALGTAHATSLPNDCQSVGDWGEPGCQRAGGAMRRIAARAKDAVDQAEVDDRAPVVELAVTHQFGVQSSSPQAAPRCAYTQGGYHW